MGENMLFLKRKKDQILSIAIPDSDEKILIKIVHIGKNAVLVGCDTPIAYKVSRVEVQLKTTINKIMQ
ncbi:MAG: carbon storage regulator [Flavobacterium sp.]